MKIAEKTIALTEDRKALLAKLVDRLFPDDGDGFRASNMGVVEYILSALNGPDSANWPVYSEMLDWVQRRLQDSLSAEDLDVMICALEAGEGPKGAFEMLRRDVLRGLFSDPVHGGNRDMAGWRFLGHPGLLFPTTPAPADNFSDHRVYDGQSALSDFLRPKDLPTPPEYNPDEGLSDPVSDADVVIVGGGAVGSMVAAWLAVENLRVVILEAGSWRKSDEYRPDELAQAFYGRADLGAKFNAEAPRWVESQDEADSKPLTFSLGRMANGVGGSSVLYGARFRRFHPHHFQSLTAIGNHGRTRTLPSDHTVTDWPVTYDELEPFYTELEQLIGVAGDPSPFTPRSAPLPLEPLPDFPAGKIFARTARRMGLHPTRVPVGRVINDRDGVVPSYSPWDEGIGSDAPSRWTPLTKVLPDALSTGRVHLRTNCRALRITVDSEGKATGVRYRDPRGEEKEQKAKKVILAAYTFETVRLMAMSRGHKHSNGLGNSYDQLGRNFMAKMFPQVIGQFDNLYFNRHLGPGGQAVIVEDLISDAAFAANTEFVGGGTMSTENQLLPLQIAQDIVPPDAPRWGAGFKGHLRNWNSRLAVKIQADAMPVGRNRLLLDPEYKDPETGDPVVRVVWQLPNNDRKLHGLMQDKAEKLLKEAGASKIWKGPIETGIGCCHDVGGCRAGNDPTSSVVDADWQVHDTPGLYVFGGASFPTCPGINPTLTIWAWSLKNARKLASSML